MKFELQLKTPGALEIAIQRALIDEDRSTSDHADEAVSGRSEDAHAICARWFQFGDTITLAIDTEAETCVVLEAKPPR